MKDAIKNLNDRFPEAGGDRSKIISKLLSRETYSLENKEEKLQEVMRFFRQKDVYTLIRASALDGIGEFLPEQVNKLTRKPKNKTSGASKDDVPNQEGFVTSRKETLEVVNKIRDFDGGLFGILGREKTREKYRQVLGKFAKEQNDFQDLENFLSENLRVLEFLHTNLNNLQEVAQNEYIKDLGMVQEAADYVSSSEKDLLLRGALGDELTEKLYKIKDGLSANMAELIRNMIIDFDKFKDFTSEDLIAIEKFCAELFKGLEIYDREDRCDYYQDSSVPKFFRGLEFFDSFSERSNLLKFLNRKDSKMLIEFFSENLDLFKRVGEEISDQISKVSILKEDKSMAFMYALNVDTEGLVDLLHQKLNEDQHPIIQELLTKIENNLGFLGKLFAVKNEYFESFLSSNLNGLKFLSENIETLKTVMDAVSEEDLKGFLMKDRANSESSVNSNNSDEKPKETMRVTESTVAQSLEKTEKNQYRD